MHALITNKIATATASLPVVCALNFSCSLGIILFAGGRAKFEERTAADITLRGFSGYNTRWCLPLLPEVFPSSAVRTPALVTVMLGANDANLAGPLRGVAPSASRQHVPLDEYVANLRAIMSAVEQMGDGSARLLLITPPPCDEKAWHAHCVGTYGVPADADPNRSFATTKAYADAVVRLGRETGTATLDLHSAFEARVMKLVTYFGVGIGIFGTVVTCLETYTDLLN